MMKRNFLSVMLAVAMFIFIPATAYSDADYTMRDVAHSEETMAIVQAWADDKGFRLMESKSTPNLYVYKKGHHIVTHPVMLEYQILDAEHALIRAYVHPDQVSQVFAFGILSDTIGLESDGMTAMIPKKRGRNWVNPLFEKLNLQPID